SDKLNIKFMENKNKKILPLDLESTSHAYPDLKDFKEQQIQEDPLYTEKKRKVIRYRYIFFFFGIVFVAFGIFIFSINSIWILSWIKPIVCLVTFLLGIAAITVALILRYEKEAVREIYHKALDQLFRYYVERKGNIDRNHELKFSELLKRKFALKNPYLAAKAKMKSIEIQSLNLMDRISAANIDLETKEKLFNQALHELRDKLNHVLLDYKSHP
ncbi:MAG: hypothetical protein ACK4HV_04790, partial [Parachlamydiaceae bacterium]